MKSGGSSELKLVGVARAGLEELLQARNRARRREPLS